MGSLYRSEPMTLCQLFLQAEAAYDCLSELGELGMVQLKDLNASVNAFQRKFVNEVRRCEEMERKLRFFEKELKIDGIAVADTGDTPEAPAPREMSDLESTFEHLEKEMKDLNANAEALKRNFLDLTELKHILRKTHTFFEEVDRQYDSLLIDPQAEVTESVNLLADDSLRTTAHHSVRFEFVAGVVLRSHLPAFERMLWRICRGNVLVKQTDIELPLEDPATGDSVLKSVFLVFFQGEQLKTKVKKICEGFHATIYPCPETKTQRREMAMGVMTRIEDLNTVLSQTESHRFTVLSAISRSIRIWSIKVRKIKSIYHAMNWFNIDITRKCLIGECWCPVAHLDKIQRALRRGTDKSGCVPSAAILNRMETKEPPPTFHQTNKFTSAFQGIVDSYGVANYREVNPALFTIISFPFLFSLMFGDAGHGLLMFLTGLLMVLFEQRLIRMKLDYDIWNIFFGGRYIILLMGAFSIYAGFLYNDFFSKPMNIFGSAWTSNLDKVPGTDHLVSLDPTNNTNYKGVPYVLGMDPVWQMASNKITFLNSFKMKISIIFGVTQMFFGVVLSLQNHRYFKERINIYCEFIPQMIFLFCIFGYLVILIFYKWIAYDASKAGCAPSLLIGLINMFLMQYDTSGSCPPLYHGQEPFQKFLLCLCFLCVPWLLFAKPFYLHYKHKHGHSSADGRGGYVLMRNGGDIELQTSQSLLSIQSGDIVLHDQEGGEVVHHAEDEELLPEIGEEKEFNLGDTLIHQCIHTIEYCLGCISHTASYLRLWALSLAHAELSEVLWTMVLRKGFTLFGHSGASGIALFLMFTPWICLTVVILLLMEGLSAFLHTLRLHWVEFQSKFYKGEGYPFGPFVFEKVDIVSSESNQT